MPSAAHDSARSSDPRAWLDVALHRPLPLSRLRQAAATCRACPLWERGTQTVFGEGSAQARIVLVGEQPGDKEDLSGRPFVGPAGRLLDQALEAAHIVRDGVYVTNAVKHFKWTPRGKRRIHQRPSPNEVRACRPWLDAELALLHPDAIVCLGATAAQALLGRDFRVSEQRGEWVASDLAPNVMATIHPSALLRRTSAGEREAEYARFVQDLRKVSRRVRNG